MNNIFKCKDDIIGYNYKEINTNGNALAIFICNKYLQDRYEYFQKQYEDYLSKNNDYYSKPVDPVLKDLTGSYNLMKGDKKRIQATKTIQEFMHNIITNIKYDKVESFVENFINLFDNMDINENFYNQLYEIIDEDGKYIKLKGNRNIKIVKFLSSILNKCEFNDLSLLINIPIKNYKCVKEYITFDDINVEKDYKMIITDSLISQIGMSSFANENWSSCQVLTHRYGQSDQVFANVMDQNSVVCYITDNTKVPITTSDIDIKNLGITHNKMLCRLMLRLFKKNGQNYLILERIYPNANYLKQIIITLKEIIKDKNIILGQNVTNNFSANNDDSKELKNKFFIKNLVQQVSQKTIQYDLKPYYDNKISSEIIRFKEFYYDEANLYFGQYLLDYIRYNHFFKHNHNKITRKLIKRACKIYEINIHMKMNTIIRDYILKDIEIIKICLESFFYLNKYDNINIFNNIINKECIYNSINKNNLLEFITFYMLRKCYIISEPHAKLKGIEIINKCNIYIEEGDNCE